MTTHRFLAVLLLVLLAPAALAEVPADSTDAGEPVVIGRKLALNSAILGEEREILVRLPKGYDESDERYPVLYVLDGEWHFLSAVSAVQSLSECAYVRSQHIPKLIVVGVANTDRNRDYTPTVAVRQHGMSFPTSGSAARFRQFLEEELIPFVESRYRTHPYRVISGWSFGGLFAMHCLLDTPGLFDSYLAISPSLWWDDELLVRRALELSEAGASRPADLVMTIGTAEEDGLCYNAVKKLVAQLDAHPLGGLALTHLEIPREIHNDTVLKAQYDGLRAVFGDWSLPDSVTALGVDAVDAYYARLSTKYRMSLQISEQTFFSMCVQRLGTENPGEAVDLARQRVERFPESVMARFDLARFYHELDRLDEARTAYRDCLAAELAKSRPDTVFTAYVGSVLEDLGEETGK